MDGHVCVRAFVCVCKCVCCSEKSTSRVALMAVGRIIFTCIRGTPLSFQCIGAMRFSWVDSQPRLPYHILKFYIRYPAILADKACVSKSSLSTSVLIYVRLTGSLAGIND